MTVKERFLKYVTIHTTSDDDSATTPSTKRQFDLAYLIEGELKEMGLSQVKTDEFCYVYGLLPATSGMEHAKPMGFIAHLDTAPGFSGENVTTQIIENYDGFDVLLKGSNTFLKTKDFPHLKNLKGRTLITTDGTSLLGADDKAGIAEILTAIEILITKNIPHGNIWVAFTPDEEIGAGSDKFDLSYFKAQYAYTIDGDYEGEIAYENFNAASATFGVKGVSVHPGSAKDIMINAGAVACEIQSLLPEKETAEHTENREGFYLLESIVGTITEATLSYIVRDHDAVLFAQKLENLQAICNEMNRKYGPNTVSLEITHSYQNMYEILKDHEPILDCVRNAMKRLDITPRETPIRGGTDGARLSFLGLPCPNIGTGGYGFHGPYEHITLEGMETAVNIILEIASNPIM